ncbi:hypothetical protein [Tunicatimonas pelagia]|uniref:hypothetical protein n=1 Tax=Tunicatimonas pelagia TaxID=931531 RepID=UPI002664F855|nr:hypothetical protein [Tunicatimonas pelagia]WKN42220.1 hypothetical protein P0M28_24590 [Tunicatimonas pelagia]
MRFTIIFLLGLIFSFIPNASNSQNTTTSQSYYNLVVNHFTKRLANGKDKYGTETTPFWMASLNTATGEYPEDDTRPDDRPQRLYQGRPVEAPKGSSMYWDMPQVAMAYYLAEKTGNTTFSTSADAYIQAFFDNCVANNGRFLWGNHYYYDAFQDATLEFGSDGIAEKVDFSTETGGLHEMRPIVPSWQALWDIDPEVTEAAIRSAIEGHLTDPSTGEFNRHASNNRGHAFLEAGGVLVHAAAWLYNKTQDATLLDNAKKMASYSFSNQGPETGLLENSPNQNRWDKIYSTTEVGLWARGIIEAANYVDETTRQEWINMADEAMTAWLEYGFDPEQCEYYGILRVANGEPVFEEDFAADFGSKTTYSPDNYTSFWEPLFPRHDYPMPFAESCLKLYELTGKDYYKSACYRWMAAVQKGLPAWDGKGGYADLYGRVIHFLLGGAETFSDEQFRILAQDVADEAVERLYAQGMFRTHTGEDRYDVADMFGFLAASLIWLETGEEPDMMGLFY